MISAREKYKDHPLFAQCFEITVPAGFNDIFDELVKWIEDYNKEYKLGSILDPDMTVPKLWNNPYYKKIRDDIINKNPPEICKKSCMFFNPGY